jgi:hypothetical protein
MKASFSLEAVSNATGRDWLAASLDLTARGALQEGTGSKLDWSKTFRDAFSAKAVKRRPHYIDICCTAPPLRLVSAKAADS